MITRSKDIVEQPPPPTVEPKIKRKKLASTKSIFQLCPDVLSVISQYLDFKSLGHFEETCHFIQDNLEHYYKSLPKLEYSINSDKISPHKTNFLITQLVYYRLIFKINKRTKHCFNSIHKFSIKKIETSFIAIFKKCPDLLEYCHFFSNKKPFKINTAYSGDCILDLFFQVMMYGKKKEKNPEIESEIAENTKKLIKNLKEFALPIFYNSKINIDEKHKIAISLSSNDPQAYKIFLKNLSEKDESDLLNKKNLSAKEITIFAKSFFSLFCSKVNFDSYRLIYKFFDGAMISSESVTPEIYACAAFALDACRSNKLFSRGLRFEDYMLNHAKNKNEYYKIFNLYIQAFKSLKNPPVNFIHALLNYMTRNVYWLVEPNNDSELILGVMKKTIPESCVLINFFNLKLDNEAYYESLQIITNKDKPANIKAVAKGIGKCNAILVEYKYILSTKFRDLNWLGDRCLELKRFCEELIVSEGESTSPALLFQTAEFLYDQVDTMVTASIYREKFFNKIMELRVSLWEQSAQLYEKVLISKNSLYDEVTEEALTDIYQILWKGKNLLNTDYQNNWSQKKKAYYREKFNQYNNEYNSLE